jgi:peptide deformylase
MIRPVVLYPNQLLKSRSLEVDVVDGDIKQLAQDMIETMLSQKGIGISAPQVGQLKRAIVVMAKFSSTEPLAHWVMINPVIVSSSGKEKSGEGCLSFPGVFEQVERPTEITVKYLDLDGEPRVAVVAGLEAKCVSHEIDHLDGKLFIEKLSPIRRLMVQKALNRLT